MSTTTEVTTTETTPDAETLRLAEAAGAAREAAREAQLDATQLAIRVDTLGREMGELRAMNETAHAELRARIAAQEAELARMREQLEAETEPETETDSDADVDAPEDAETVAVPPSPPNSDASDATPPTVPSAPQRERSLLGRILLG